MAVGGWTPLDRTACQSCSPVTPRYPRDCLDIIQQCDFGFDLLFSFSFCFSVIILVLVSF